MVFLLIILLGALFNNVNASTYVKQLQFFTEAFTDNDFILWSPMGPSMPLLRLSHCSGNRTFGGYNIFFGDPINPSFVTRSWTNLIPHYAITISLKLYKLDSWLNNTIFFMVDGTTAYTMTFDNTNAGSSDICGNPTPVADTVNTNFNDAIIPVSFTVLHTYSSLSLKIITNLVSDSGSWGFREFNFSILACDQSCKTCSGPNQCLTCESSQNLYLSGSFCVCSLGLRQKYIPCTMSPCAVCLSPATCTLGYYHSATTGYCEPCNVACTTCSSSINALGTCSTCATTNGFFPAVTATMCFSCAAGCAVCTSSASNACSACKYGYFLDVNTCVQQCPFGKYGEQRMRLCYTCSSPCTSCIGNSGGSYFCLSCNPGLFIHEYACVNPCPGGMIGFNGQCYSSCPQTTYYNTIGLTCSSCGSNCLQCTNNTQCFTCATGKYLYAGGCTSSCITHYYGSNDVGLCLICHSTCLQCSGPFSDNCLSCYPAAPFLITGICYISCPTSRFMPLCLSCSSSCLSCNGLNPNQCLTCSAPFFYHLNDFTCISGCSQGQIANNFNLTCLRCAVGKVAYFQQCVDCSPTCLTCTGTTFLDCSSCVAGTTLQWNTCVLDDERSIVYKPYDQTGSFVNAFVGILITHVAFSFVLEIFFQYKTSLLSTIEIIQILSYTRFLTLQFSVQTQRLANILYPTNFVAYLNPIITDPHPSLQTKFVILGKTGYFIIDSLGIQIIMIGAVVLYLIIQYLKTKNTIISKIYDKISPYLISYTFRLILLELSLDIILYISCFDVSSGLGIGSITILMVDIVLIIFGMCWKVTNQDDGQQMALFYYNQFGSADGEKKVAESHKPLPEQQETHNSIKDKIRKSSILPSVMQLLLKVPIPITIVLFVGNQSTQTISFFIYFVFYALLILIIPIKRKFYKMIMLFNSFFLVLNGLGTLLLSKSLISSQYFDQIWLSILIILFSLSILQAAFNYRYFVDIFRYLIHKARSQQIEQQKQIHNNESNSNMTSMQDQSVVFQTHEKEKQVKRGASGQIKKANPSWGDSMDE